MSGITFDTPLSGISGIGPRFVQKLKKLGIETVGDLLRHFPTRYEDFSRVTKIRDIVPREECTIEGVVRHITARRAWRKRMFVIEAWVEDDTGEVRAVWFNQTYIQNVLREGVHANLSGKVSVSREGEYYFSNPNYEVTRNYSESFPRESPPAPGLRRAGAFSPLRQLAEVRALRHTGRIVPIYPETSGLTSKGLRFLIQPLLEKVTLPDEIIPRAMLEKESLPSFKDALRAVHFPDSIKDALRAKRRFAFEDILLLELTILRERARVARESAPAVAIDVALIKEHLAALPFALTVSQKAALWDIVRDLDRGHPMNRLLQGDVGSGKTIVAALAAILTAHREYQTAFMAPTEILARQHYATITKFFPEHEGGIALLTASEARVYYGNGLETTLKKLKLRREIAAGKIKVVIGTHALLEKNVALPALALVIVDEQHRFGVRQRATLLRGQTQTETRTNADGEFLYSDLTYKLRGCAFTVRKNVGLGQQEIVYQKAFASELEKAGILHEREKQIPIIYSGKKIAVYQPDFVIDNKIIIELKALPFVGIREKRQLWTYLKSSDYKLALLINFAPDDVHFERVVYDDARSQRTSASRPRESALSPHFLSMSATPIPRTLSLTVFGDLDLSLITELPKDRKSTVTKIVPPESRNDAYRFIRKEIQEGRQAFVVCPRIENTNEHESPAYGTNQIRGIRGTLEEIREIKTVTEEYEKLAKKIFPDLAVAMLHGKMKAAEKERTMREFAENRVNILVATSVVEVGIDVPNATIMMIEGAERFGLAQLYQFKGRVGRGNHQSYCFLFSESSSEETRKRLAAVATAKNGFELAERDLALRGPGEFLGNEQTGMPDIAMKALQNPELVTHARRYAEEILKKDPTLANHAALNERLQSFAASIHRE